MKQTPSYETQEIREFAEVLSGRRTIELFLQTKVSSAIVEEAIELATWAPNHYVTEPWHFYAMGDETRERCLKLCRELVTAKKGEKAGDFKYKSWSEKPGWLVVTCERSDDSLMQNENYAACCAAVQNLALYFWKSGVGMKWTTGDITRDSRFFDILGLSEDTEFVVGLIWYGYPKVVPTQSRRPLSESMTVLP